MSSLVLTRSDAAGPATVAVLLLVVVALLCYGLYVFGAHVFPEAAAAPSEVPLAVLRLFLVVSCLLLALSLVHAARRGRRNYAAYRTSKKRKTRAALVATDSAYSASLFVILVGCVYTTSLVFRADFAGGGFASVGSAPRNVARATFVGLLASHVGLLSRAYLTLQLDRA